MQFLHNLVIVYLAILAIINISYSNERHNMYIEFNVILCTNSVNKTDISYKCISVLFSLKNHRSMTNTDSNK